MKQDKHYIDEKELWKVTIELEDDQIRSKEVTNLVDYPSLWCSLFFSTVLYFFVYCSNLETLQQYLLVYLYESASFVDNRAT